MKRNVIVFIVKNIVLPLLMCVIGIFISARHYHNYEKQQTKVDTFKRFFSNRYDLKGDEFSKAINEIFVVFHESEEVISALRAFHQTTVDEQDSEDELLKLHKAICKDVNIDFDEFNDSFFLKPFNARPTSRRSLDKT